MISKKKTKIEICPDKKTAMVLNRSIPPIKQQEGKPNYTNDARMKSSNKIHEIKEVKEIMEPVIFNGEPYWLVVRQEEFSQDSGRDAKDVAKNPLPSKTVTKFILRKPGLWQCQKCACVIESNPDEPAMCYEELGGCGRTTTFKQLTKIIKTGIWKLPVWEESEVDGFDMYDGICGLMKDLVVFPEEILYKIFTLWIISTWKQECWETVGFPVFRGIMGSGKTRALNVIQELAYRCVPCATATFVAVGRLSHFCNVSLTIDEANSQLNPKTESGAQLLQFVKQSYKKGSKYLLGDKDDPTEVNAINNFGFKAFAGEKSFNPALVNRGIDVFMEKADPPGKKINYFDDEFNRIRTQLLNYKYKTDDPPDLGRAFVLKGRTREVYESIIATGEHIGQEVDDIIKFAQEREEEAEEELQGTVQYEILRIIKNKRENETLDDTPEVIKIVDISEDLGWEGTSKDMQKLGYILSNMGLKTKRTREGRIINLADRTNSRRIGGLYRRYQITK